MGLCCFWEDWEDWESVFGGFGGQLIYSIVRFPVRTKNRTTRIVTAV
jgi:hypothetical protein